MTDDATQVVAAIRSYRFTYANEDALQAGVAAALHAHGYTVEREVRLDGHGRIDLLVNRVGIEAKIAGSAAEVRRQLDRYAHSPFIDALVLVTGRVTHLNLPEELNGKPLHVITLAAAGL